MEGFNKSRCDSMLGHDRPQLRHRRDISESYFAISYLSVTVCAFNSPDTALLTPRTFPPRLHLTFAPYTPNCASDTRKFHTSAMPSAVKPPQTLYDKVFEDHIVEEKADGTVLLYIGTFRAALLRARLR